MDGLQSKANDSQPLRLNTSTLFASASAHSSFDVGAGLAQIVGKTGQIYAIYQWIPRKFVQWTFLLWLRASQANTPNPPSVAKGQLRTIGKV